MNNIIARFLFLNIYFIYHMLYLRKSTSINDIAGETLKEPNVLLTADKGTLYVDIPNAEKEFIYDTTGKYTVTFDGDISNYSLYYEDVNGHKLANWDKLPSKFNPCAIAPYTAVQIGVYNNDEKLGIIGLKNKSFNVMHKFGERLYRVGLMSDVHYNDTCAARETEHNPANEDDSWSPYEDLENALEFYNNIENIDFVSIAGDISTDSIEHVHSFYNRVQSLSPDTPVYTCKGNHDNAASYGKNNLWLQYTIPQNSKYEIQYFTSGDKTSFYFVTENTDVYIYFNVDYNSGSNSASVGSDGVNYVYYNPETIIELHYLLDRYRNNRCFIFTHQYFSQKSGNPYWDYSESHWYGYYLVGKQFDILNALNNYYKNSVWFSGHTHYQWQWENITSRANICNFDIFNNNYNKTDWAEYSKNTNNKYDLNWHTDCIKSAWNVHLPSTCRPLIPGNYTGVTNYSNKIVDPGSEGAVMDVYADGVNIRGIVFADKNTPVETVEEIEQLMEFRSRNFIADTSKSGYSSDQTVSSENLYIVLTFTAPSQRFILKTYASQNVKFDDVIVIDGNGNDITSELLAANDPYIGCFTTANKYSLTNCVGKLTDSSADAIGIEFPCSSKFQGTFPITLKFKGKTVVSKTTTKINYDTHYSSQANYWLSVGGVNAYNIESKNYEYFETLINK